MANITDMVLRDRLADIGIKEIACIYDAHEFNDLLIPYIGNVPVAIPTLYLLNP